MGAYYIAPLRKVPPVRSTSILFLWPFPNIFVPSKNNQRSLFMYPDEETRTSMKMSKFTERTLPEDLNIKEEIPLHLRSSPDSSTDHWHNIHVVTPHEYCANDLLSYLG